MGFAKLSARWALQILCLEIQQLKLETDFPPSFSAAAKNIWTCTSLLCHVAVKILKAYQLN